MTADRNRTRALAGALLRGEPHSHPRLVVRNGPDTGRTLALGESQTIGRGRGADLRLSDPAASRLHVRLTRTDGGFALADLRSKNGVRINGVACRRTRTLKAGDELAIGGSLLTLEPGLLDAIPAGGEATASPMPGGDDPGGALPAWGVPALLAAAATLVAAAALLL